MEITFTDGTLDEIVKTIGTRTPETGGALFGPENSNLVSLFVFDETARTTAVTYTPSNDLIQRIPKIESREGITFKGVIHSHPPRVDRPSGPDLSAFRRTLERNPRLRSLTAPIVNLDGGSKHADAHRLNDDTTMRVFQVFRASRGRLVDIESATVCVMPIDAVTRCVTDALEQELETEIRTLKRHEILNGHAFVQRTLAAPDLAGDTTLDFYFPPQFPLLPPLLRWCWFQEPRWLKLNWQPDQFSADALATHITRTVSPPMSKMTNATKEKENCHVQC